MERMEACDRLFSDGRLCYQQGRYEQAINCFQTSLNIYQEKEKYEKMLLCLMNIGNCYRILWKCQKTVAKYQEYMPIFTKNSINGNLKGRFFLGLGDCLRDIHKYQDSQDCLKKALEIAKQNKGSQLECDCYQSLAKLCFKQQQYHKALEYANHATRVAEQDNLIAEKYSIDHTLGNVYLSLGRPREAIDAFSRYLEYHKQCGKTYNMGQVLQSLSNCFLEINEYDKAMEFAQETISISKKRGNLLLECAGYSNIGKCLNKIGQNEEAMQYHKKALDVAIKTSDKELEAIALQNFGNVCSDLSQFSDAMAFYRKSQTLCSQLGHENTMQAACNGLGIIYVKTGRYQEAAEYFEQWLVTIENSRDRTFQEVVYQNLAGAYYRLNRMNLSVECKWKAIIIGIQRSGKLKEIEFLSNLAECFCLNRDFKKGIQFYKKALLLSLHINNSEYVGVSYANIAGAYHLFGMTSKAIGLYKLALRTFTESGHRDKKAGCLFEIACAFHKLNHETEEQLDEQTIQMPEQYLRESIQTHEEIFDDLKDNYDLKISIVDTYIHSIKLLAKILIEQGRYHEGLFICDRCRACALDDTMMIKYGMQQQLQTQVSLDNIDLTGLLPEKSCLLFFSIVSKIVYSWVLSQTQPLHFQINAYDESDSTEHLNKYISQLVDIAYQSIGVREMTDNDCEDRSLQNHTEDSEIYQSYVQTCDSISRMLLEDMNYTSQTNPSSTSRGPTEAKASGSSQEPLKELFKQLITPIQEFICEDEIVIVPEGPLYRVPFSALQDPQTGRYLCESHRIRIAPSLSTLKILKESPPDYHCSKDALVVGNPCTGIVMFRGKKKRFTNLSNAEMEASLFGSILGTSPLIGRAATKNAVKERLKDANIVHIAAHGDINTGEIALAPGSSAESKPIPDEKDYMLTMQEVQEIGVRAKLVVLSCCHSGRGEIRAEGVVGMARAFLAAGARSVVAALWAISDQATLDFMAGFYTHLKYSESVSEGLNESRKELIKERKYKHPKYWAPFVLIGDDVTIF